MMQLFPGFTHSRSAGYSFLNSYSSGMSAIRIAIQQPITYMPPSRAMCLKLICQLSLGSHVGAT